MKVVITSKNMNANDRLKDTIEKKMEKLSKYFSDNIIVNVTLSAEKNRQKIEATIRVRGMIFRAEDVSGDIYEGIDNVVEKLSTQMSRFKTKIQKKHKDNKDFVFADWPEEVQEEIKVVKTDFITDGVLFLSRSVFLFDGRLQFINDCSSLIMKRYLNEILTVAAVFSKSGMRLRRSLLRHSLLP